MFQKHADTGGNGTRSNVAVTGGARALANLTGNQLNQGNLRVRRTTGRPTNIGGSGTNVTVNPALKNR